MQYDFHGPRPDAAPELVELREAEPLGVLDQHDRGIRDVDADLDDGGGDEDVDLAGLEAPHDRVLVVERQPPVEQADHQIGKDLLLQLHAPCRWRP